MKPICVPCQRFFRPTESGHYFIEAKPKPGPYGPRPRSGTVESERWEPYKVWLGDLWECPGCGARIVSGVGRLPVAEHYEATFAETVARTHADQLIVNDC